MPQFTMTTIANLKDVESRVALTESPFVGDPDWISVFAFDKKADHDPNGCPVSFGITFKVLIDGKVRRKKLSSALNMALYETIKSDIRNLTIPAKGADMFKTTDFPASKNILPILTKVGASVFEFDAFNEDDGAYPTRTVMRNGIECCEDILSNFTVAVAGTFDVDPDQDRPCFHDNEAE